jgi:hypothetical protein
VGRGWEQRSRESASFAIGCEEVEGGLTFEQMVDARLLEECNELCAAAHGNMLAGVEQTARLVMVCKGACPAPQNRTGFKQCDRSAGLREMPGSGEACYSAAYNNSRLVGHADDPLVSCKE